MICDLASGSNCWLELHSPEEAYRFLGQLLADLHRCGYTAKERFGIRLALEEALANALKHGHKGDGAKTVRFRLHLTPEEISAEVEDEGAGFDPAQVPDPRDAGQVNQPGGRGVFLMRKYMTEVEYNAAGNRVTLRKVRQASA